MTRTIKAREIKEGMNIRFDLEGWDVKGIVARMHRRPQGMWLYTDQSLEMSLDLDTPVTVLSEPQPEEPTAFGARVVVNGRRFLRSPVIRGDSQPWLEENGGIWRDWDDLCALGPVQVVPNQGWTVPETPEVPDRIEEWPEDDTALRAYQWRDTDGDAWYWHLVDGGWGYNHATFPKPFPGCFPMTRVTDA